MAVSEIFRSRSQFSHEFGSKGANWSIDDAFLAMTIVRAHSEQGMFKNMEPIEEELRRHGLLTYGAATPIYQTMALMNNYNRERQGWDQVLDVK